ncbi:hypothetical protein KH5H1_41250 [Corallococcus caeni]|uniref:hypothetical protein n=1 Tax=Corallococcus caeni TaxID=3082388 RepID=UPI0029577875|nr:hypothetical protein KH5H1_41250 [Corallococcus sp. KH5-1]
MRFVQVVWIFVGAYFGPVASIALMSFLPKDWLRWLDVLDIPLGPGVTLPGIAMLWLLSLVLGAIAALWAWRWRFERRTQG